jgi:hypothetical protein
MKAIMGALLVLAVAVIPARADAPVSAEDAQKIQATLQAWGCSGGKMEKESEGTGVYEVDDTNARTGSTTSSSTRISRSSS